jgi:autotransporter-associated beta strand protein
MNVRIQRISCGVLASLAIAGSLMLGISSASAQAISNTWDTDADGNWTDVLNWAGDAAYAGGADNTATFGDFITDNRTVTLNAPITIGNITASDTTHNYTISGANILTLDRTSGSPSINVTTSTRALTISSDIAGNDGLTKAGLGTLTLSGNNTYTGVTTHGAANGILIVASNNALGSTAAGSHTNITLSGTDGRYVGVNSGVDTPENFTISGSSGSGSTAIRGLSGTATLSGTITLAGSGQIRLGGTIAGTALNWTGTITQSTTSHGLLFYGTNTVSNAMTINGGGLQVATGTLTLNGVNPTNGTGLGDASTFGGSFTLGVTNALRTDGNLSYDGGLSRLNLNGNNQTIKGLISAASTNYTVNNNASSTTSTLTVGNGGGDYSFGGTIINNTTGNGTVALVKTGAGNQTLTGINTFTGGTRIDEGTLTLGNATNTLSNTGAVNVNGGTLALGTNSDTVGAVTLTSGSITSSSGVLTGASYAVQSGSVSAILGGSGVALTKSTTGTVTLTGNNTYTGATTISAGTLVVNGSLAGGSAVSVGANGTLGGTGTINGAVTITGAHTPGTSPGIQTFASDLTYSGGNSTVQWELVENTTTNPPNPNADYDQVIVGGNLDFAGATSLSLVFNGVGSTVSWANAFWSSNQSWTLYDVTGSTTNFGNLSLAAGSYLDSASNTLASARPGASFSLVQSGQDVLINYVAVPEPTTIAILGSVVGLLGLRLARRRKA